MMKENWVSDGDRAKNVAVVWIPDLRRSDG
jgi:hypothetical protein